MPGAQAFGLDACRLGAPNLRVGRLSRAAMRGPEEWSSCGTWPSRRAQACREASPQTEFGLQVRLPTIFIASFRTTHTLILRFNFQL